MIHLTLNQISAYIDAELPEASVELVRLHLSSCLECTNRFGHVEEQEEALSRLLVNDPGDGFFASFSDRVVGPVPQRVPAVTKESWDDAPGRPEPRAPAPVAAAPRAQELAAPVAAAPRVRERATPPKPGPSRQTRRRRGGASRFLLPAAALLLVATSVAVVAARSQWTGLATVRALTSSLPWLRAAPGTGGSRIPESVDGETPARTEGSPAGPGAGVPDLLERAAAASAAADRAGTAESHDAAAEAWERAIPGLASNADELAAGRREIASARLQAWSAEPTSTRRESAMHAVRAYLLCTPPGADRDTAWAWLARLKR